jgi:hypothetical protein
MQGLWRACDYGRSGRFHITWDNDATLKIETEAGKQTPFTTFQCGAASDGGSFLARLFRSCLGPYA